MGYVVVHGEDVFQLVLVREYVDHPGEDARVKRAAFGLAGFGGAKGAEHAEFWVLAEILLHAIGRGRTEVFVHVPARNAEWNPVVQFIFGRVRWNSEHHAFQPVALGRGFAIEQGGRLGRVKMVFGFRNVDLIVEMELGLVHFRVPDHISVGQSLAVVLVALDGCFHLRHHRLGLLLVPGLPGPQRRDVHVPGHCRHAGAHIPHVVRATHVHTGHAALGLVRLLLRVRGSCGQRQHTAGERKE